MRDEGLWPGGEVPCRVCLGIVFLDLRRGVVDGILFRD